MATGGSPLDDVPPRMSLNQIIRDQELHAREKTLIICQRVSEFVHKVIQDVETAPVTFSVENPLVRRLDISSNAAALTLLTLDWVDDDLRAGIPFIKDLMWKVAYQSDVIKIQVFSMIAGLQSRDLGLIVQSGRKLFLTLLFLSQVCGEVTLMAWFLENRPNWLEGGEHIKLNYISDRTRDLPDVNVDVLENFMVGCSYVIAQTFEDLVSLLSTCERETRGVVALTAGPGLFISQVIRQVHIVYAKTRGLVQKLYDWGVGRAASDDQRRPHRYHNAIYWRLQMLMFRLKLLTENVGVSKEVVIALVKGCKTARKRLSHQSKVINSLSKQLISLHYVRLPTVTNDLQEEAADAAAAAAEHVDHFAAAYAPAGGENFTLLPEGRARELQHVLCDVGIATYKLIGQLNVHGNRSS